MPNLVEVTISEESLVAINSILQLRRAMERDRLEVVIKALKEIPDDIFPRGKWATIQELQRDLLQ